MLKFMLRDSIHRTPRETGVDVKARTYSVLSHLGTMLFVQFVHALSLNDGCGSRPGPALPSVSRLPRATTSSNSNQARDAKFAELVFWRTLAHLQHHDRSFGR